MKAIVDGNTVAGRIAHLMSEICFLYPITPSSPIASEVNNLCEKDHKNLFNESVLIKEMQSEAGAIGAMHGSLINGTLTSTFTSSQGLLLMIPNLYKMAGEGLPGVLHVASRSIATNALSIFGDHSDIYAIKNTGVCILASSNLDEIESLGMIAHLASVKGRLPFVHFYDGFRTSHEINTYHALSDEDLLSMVDYDAIKAFKKEALSINDYQRGMAFNEDIFFQTQEARNNNYTNMVDTVTNIMNTYNQKFNKNLAPFNYYGKKDAEYIVVAMGSVVDTIKLVIDSNPALKIGVIGVHLFRPFSKDLLIKSIPSTVKRIAVLDRAKECGSTGEGLYLDVLSTFKDLPIKIIGGRYGLSSKNTTPNQIMAVYANLMGKCQDNFTIGINDDLTNLSLADQESNVKINSDNIIVYGLGGDGSVSLSKDLIKLIGNNTPKFVQGYNRYDSKKSNGLTVSYLRISDELIRAPYYIENTDLVVVNNDLYLSKYDLFSKAKDGSKILLNTSKALEDLRITKLNYQNIIEKNLKIYTIDAFKIAEDNNLNNKISTIMEEAINKLENFNITELLIASIKKNFLTKGEEVVNNNINAVRSVSDISEVKDIKFKEVITESDDILLKISNDYGNTLSVKDLVLYQDGKVKNNNSLIFNNKLSKTAIWDSEKCIGCGLCDTVCPHGVIKPTFNSATNKYEVHINASMCEACGLCEKVCPTKAITMGENDSIVDNNKNYQKPTNLKELSLNESLFNYSGACSGCGETQYIKMLTKIFNHELVIANATGCSSIYGGSMPLTPYNIPWANSLFEDNGEFGYGILNSINYNRNRIKNIMVSTMDIVTPDIKELYQEYLANSEDYLVTKRIKEELAAKEIPADLKELIEYIPKKSVWAIGGDGWAYDIGYSGIDHVLASNENINILVLDTETYSNTGGQASKASRVGQVAEFANLGKRTNKKDLFRIATCYPNVYVAETSILANPMHTMKVLKEAGEHIGPSIVICYATCNEQGISCGLKNSIEEQKKLVKAGYNLLMHYCDGKLYLDSPKPDFSLLEETLLNEVRYKALKLKDEKLYQELLSENLKYLEERYNYYSELANKN